MEDNQGIKVDPVEEQIQRAAAVMVKHGYTAECVVKVSRPPGRGKPSYGFHFENGRAVGDEFVEDGDRRVKVMAIVTPAEAGSLAG